MNIYGAAEEKDLLPVVTSIFPLGGSNNKLRFDLKLCVDFVYNILERISWIAFNARSKMLK